ncbi:MAG: hypothetical protein WAT71_11850 [Ignavibacteria bacterium]
MAKNEKYKILLITGLGIVLVILTFIFLNTELDIDAVDNSLEKKAAMTPDKFKKDIDSIIYSFGIKEEWKIKVPENKVNISGDKGLAFAQSIRIPVDIQTINLNLDITNYLEKNGFVSKTLEDPRSKDIMIEIFQVKDSLQTRYAKLNFVYSKDISRNISETAIVLDSIEYIDYQNAEIIIKSVEKFSVFLPIGNDKADYQSMIIDNSKNYLLKFYIGNDDDITSDFRTEMKENVIRQKVRTAAVNFPGVSGVVLYYPKGMKEFAEKISSEFKKNNFTVFSDTLFKSIKTEENKVSKLFEEIKRNSDKGIKVQFYTVSFTEKDFTEFENRTEELKKPGYKFISINEAVKLISDQNPALEKDTLSVKN